MLTDRASSIDILRQEVIEDLQRFLVAAIQAFHNRQRIKVQYDPSKSTWQFIRDLLSEARATNKEGPVAQYLVGAKLQLRYPDQPVSNESFSTADVQTGRKGDFLFGDTVFHVTVAPATAVYDKCHYNVQEGYQVYLLVPDRSMVGARQNAELAIPGRVTVESIESFVAQNLDELATFSRSEKVIRLHRLLETYNERVDQTEKDKSMLIEIPQNLRPRSEKP